MSLEPNTPDYIKMDAFVQDPPGSITKLDALLAGLPAKDRAEVWRGVALNLAERLRPSENFPQ